MERSTPDPLVLMERAATGPGALAVLREAFVSDDVRLRRRAIVLAAREVPAPELCQFLTGGVDVALRGAAIEALERMGPLATDALIDLTGRADAKAVMFATQLLAKVIDARVVERMIELTHHADLNVAQAAIEVIGHTRARAAVPRLRTLLREHDWLRFAAVIAIGEIGVSAAVPDVVPLLADDFLAEAAAEALGRLRDPAALPPLVALAGAGSAVDAETLIRAIARIASAHPEAAHAVLRDAPRAQRQALDAIVGPLLGPPRSEVTQSAIVVAAAAALDGHAQTLLEIAGADGRLSGHTLAQLRSWPAAISSAWAAAVRGPGETAARRGALLAWTPAIGEAARVEACFVAPEPPIRRAALVAAGRDRSAAGAQRLVRHADQVSPPDLELLIDQLAGLGELARADILARLDAADDGEALARWLWIAAAARLPVPSAQLERAAHHAVAAVRWSALRALAHLDPRRAEQLARALLDDPDPVCVRAALEICCHHRVAMADVAYLITDGGDVQDQAIAAAGAHRCEDLLDALTRAARTGAALIRSTAIFAIDRIGGASVGRRLAGLLADPDPDVRSVAARAIAHHASREDLDQLRALADSDDWTDREAAVVGLGRVGGRDAEELLRRLVVDDDDTVSDAARGTLRTLALHTTDAGGPPE